MAKTKTPIRYRVLPTRPGAHVFQVRCIVEQPDGGGQRFALPAWIPGSYMIREFARHIVRIEARCGRKAVPLRKLDKHTWQAEACDGPLIVDADIYAWDLSVRAAHLDTTHAFFNGTSLFLRVLGQEERPCEVELLRPRGRGYARWRVATTLRRKRAPAYGFGLYAARDYDELIDHPVEMGTFTLAQFKAHGVPHDIAITGRHQADIDRLRRDLQRICEWHIDLFGRPAPMDRYLFLVMAVGEGYGGLEHRSSTALLCSRDDLPAAGMRGVSDAYRGFLGLCSHEYFHTWNVKRIKPAAFSPYDLNTENYTSLLWAFEGFTSYYDDLALVRSGVISPRDYLETLGRAITQLQRTGGRLQQTVAESSWDAWIKYYRQDENTPNAVVSYYLKGSLIALCLDAAIRKRRRGRKSLDDLMRALWERHGKTGAGVPEGGIEKLAAEIAGGSLRDFFRRALRSTEELPLAQALRDLGVVMKLRQAEANNERGGRPTQRSAAQLAARGNLGARAVAAGNEVRLSQVYTGGAAETAGLSAGDTIVALDGLRANAKDFDARIAARRPDSMLRVHAFRRDELHEFNVRLQGPAQDTCELSFGPRRTAAQRAWVDDT
jgi:predicted metalloprotease with PDZ domain